MCRPITVGYAFKKDTKGERHGTPAERLLAEQQRKKAAAQSRPNTLFATGKLLRAIRLCTSLCISLTPNLHSHRFCKQLRV